MLRKVDDVIFDRFPAIQKLSEIVEYYTFANHATQAHLVMITGSAFYGSQVMQTIYESGDVSLWASIFTQGIIVIIFLVVAQIQATLSRTNDSTKNIMRQIVPYMYIRLTFVLLFITQGLLSFMHDNALGLEVVRSFTVCVTYYLIACDPLPPGDRFWSQFFKKVAA